VPRVDVRVGTPIKRTARVVQIEGTFDLPPSKSAEHVRAHELPIEAQPWTIGMIVGPSGSGKSRLLDTMYPTRAEPAWGRGALVDDFPAELPISEVTGVLTAVGLSSPPAWVRSHATLSNGEQFRADLAWRLLAEPGEIVAVDEFTSVVDRNVAHVASAAVARYTRRAERRLVVAACHYDIIEWLQPDWLYDTGTQTFEWRCLQRRPPIDIDIVRATDRSIWSAFAPHHYLTGELAKGAKLFVAEIAGRPAAMTSCLHMPHPKARGIWREHSTVVLPDYQGVGIGNAVVEKVASIFRGAGLRWRATGSHPGIVQHRARSPLWDMDRRPGFVAQGGRRGIMGAGGWRESSNRRTASFEYVGPAAPRGDVELLIPELADRTSVRRTKARPARRTPG
jgi:ABC-type ATPase involved in cell division